MVQTPDDLRAKVFEDRETAGNWRVEKMDEDGGYEAVKVFSGPDARDQAIRYAKHEFGDYDEIRLEPYRCASDRFLNLLPNNRTPGRVGRRQNARQPRRQHPLAGSDGPASLGSGRHLPAATFGTDQPLAPIEHGRFGAVPRSHLGGIGLD